MVWEVEVRNEIALKYSKGKWKDASGSVLAEEKNSGGEREGITIIAPGLEVNMKDLIVAAWAARVWQGNGRVGLARTLMRGEGSTSRAPVLHQWRAFRDR
jgi:hypothetical protein